ncbi:MAG: MFS transporter [Lachnospiraceae bacterium]
MLFPNAILCLLWGAALGAILAGILIKKMPIRVMMVIGAAGTGMAFMGISVADRLWHFYVLLLLADLFMALITNVPLTTMINNWYIDKRGMMTGLVFAGAGLGSIVLSPLCEWTIQAAGGYASATISGAIILVNWKTQ